MTRLFDFFRYSIRQRDWFGLVVFASITGVAVWAAAIVVSPGMRDLALRRFHLATSNYPLWAAHQAVPAMYNFENQVQFTNELIGDTPFDVAHNSYRHEFLNHFPARLITFGDQAPRLFGDTKHGTFEMSSRFGDTQLISRWTIQPDEVNTNVLTVHRHPQQWVRDDEH